MFVNFINLNWYIEKKKFYMNLIWFCFRCSDCDEIKMFFYWGIVMVIIKNFSLMFFYFWRFVYLNKGVLNNKDEVIDK